MPRPTPITSRRTCEGSGQRPKPRNMISGTVVRCHICSNLAGVKNAAHPAAARIAKHARASKSKED